MVKKNSLVLGALLFLTVAAVFNFYYPNIPDLDSFYYWRLATVYRDSGIFNVDFPWIYHSVIRELTSSLWYGFGVILIPFTLLGNSITAIKITGVILTAGLLLSYYWVFRRHQIRFPILWPLLLFFSAPNVLSQLLMVRPQIVSLALIPLLWSFLITGNLLPVFLTAFGITWAHLNFAWAPLLVLGATVAVKLALEKRFMWKESLASLAGILAGWLSRPEPIKAAKLFYIQVFQQVLEKQSGAPLLFGKENFPLSVDTLISNFSFFMIFWVGAAIALIFFLKKFKDALIWSPAVLSVGFFIMTMVFSRRAYNLWAEFGIIFIAATLTFILKNRIFSREAEKLVLFFVGAFFVILILFSGYKGAAAISNSGYPSDYLKEIGLWLEQNSNNDDIVFNLHWPHFSPLFFWNQKNHYVGGLDPIFQYSYNPSLYWKFHYLATGQVTEKTCGAIACTREMLEDTYEVLVRDFNARYVVLNKLENPAVNSFLENDARFEKKIVSGNEIIYLIRR